MLNAVANKNSGKPVDLFSALISPLWNVPAPVFTIIGWLLVYDAGAGRLLQAAGACCKLLTCSCILLLRAFVETAAVHLVPISRARVPLPHGSCCLLCLADCRIVAVPYSCSGCMVNGCVFWLLVCWCPCFTVCHGVGCLLCGHCRMTLFSSTCETDIPHSSTSSRSNSTSELFFVHDNVYF